MRNDGPKERHFITLLKPIRGTRLLYTSDHQPENHIRYGSWRPHQMDVCETCNKRTIKGARGINSLKSRGFCGHSLHVPKEFACGGPRDLAGDLERYMCPTCLRPA